jgi:two-component system, NtrC family, sensor kinase
VKHIRQVALGVKAQARGVDVEEQSDLKEIVEFAVKLSRVEVGQRARVTIDGPPIQVKVGPVSICQILLNLIVNAAQAMEGTGRKGLVEIRWQEGPGGVVLKVIDNGGGIPPELLQKVFEPLFTTKPAGVGTGLGLPICKELIENAGGSIRLESKVGEGTTIALTLPRP